MTALLNYVGHCTGASCAKGGSSKASHWIDISSRNSTDIVSYAQRDPENYLLDGLDLSTGSTTLYESAPGYTFGTPFASGNFYTDNKTNLEVKAYFRVPATSKTSWTNDIRFTLYNSWNNESHGVFIGPEPSSTSSQYDGYISYSDSPEYYSGISNSDIALLSNYHDGIWINGTKPTAILLQAEGVSIPMPDAEFPFPRLASVILPDGSAYLYHQINGSTFAEEQWDASVHAWLPASYIVVSES